MSRARLVGLVAVLAVVALAAAALIPGSHSTATTGARAGVARKSSPENTLKVRQKAIFGSKIPAKEYGTFIAQREQGVDAQGQLTSELDPVPARAFTKPVAAYRRYAERWAASLGRDVGRLEVALRAGDRAAARRVWASAFADYLHLGAVYGLLPQDLNDALAAVPASLSQQRFTGLHRIEKGLWTGQPVRSLVPVAEGVAGADVRLRRILPGVRIDPLDYATRAHEILEDAQRDLMSGAQVPWSGAGVLGTASGVAATREVIGTLAPLLRGRENTLGATQNNLLALRAALDSVRRADGTYPTLTQLSLAQHERLEASLDGTLGALAQVPGTLETTEIPRIPGIR